MGGARFASSKSPELEGARFASFESPEFRAVRVSVSPKIMIFVKNALLKNTPKNFPPAAGWGVRVSLSGFLRNGGVRVSLPLSENLKSRGADFEGGRLIVYPRYRLLPVFFLLLKIPKNSIELL